MSEDLTKKLPISDSDKLNSILTTVQAMETRLGKLEQKVEDRLHDTRPIWHKVVADIAQLQTGQDAMSEQLGELYSTVREVNRDQIVINDSLRRIQLDLRTFDERIHRCEMNRRAPNSST